MNSYKSSTASFALCLILTAMPCKVAHACSGCTEGPVVVNGDVPDTVEPTDVTAFLSGDLGVVRPYLLPTYLSIVYRFLTNHPLADQEKEGLEPFLLRSKDCDLNSLFSIGCDNGVTRWNNAMNDRTPGRVSPPDPAPVLDEETYTYSTVVNDDAYTNAAATYWVRKERWGRDSPQLADWVKAQEDVFAQKKPEPAPPDADALLSADREYQIAAYYFYLGAYDTARSMFERIARDVNSPWQAWGLYLAARTEIRANHLEEARKLLEEIAQNPELSPRHRAAQRLLRHLLFRADFAKAMLVTFQELENPPIDRPLLDILRDLSFLSRQAGSISAIKYVPFQSLSLDYELPPMAEWLTTFWNPSSTFVPNDGYAGENDVPLWRENVLRRWRKYPASMPWVLAAISAVLPNTTEASEVLAAAEAVPLSSPAGPTIRYHQIRILLGSGDRERASRYLKEILADPRVGNSLARRQPFKEFELVLSESQDSFVESLELQQLNTFCGLFPDVPIRAATTPAEKVLSVTGSEVLTRGLPLSRLMTLAEDIRLSTYTRLHIALAIWSRSVLLQQEEIALQIVPIISKLEPKLAKVMDSYRRASSPSERERKAALLMARSPYIRAVVLPTDTEEDVTGKVQSVYNYNWWCSSSFSDQSGSRSPNITEFHSVWPAISGDIRPQFLTPEQRQQVEVEMQGLKKYPSAGSFFLQVATEWNAAEKGAPEIPELLHHTVMVDKWKPCGSDSGKRAFKLLHKEYPNSTWAKRTPYYY